jgi:hypothetical protein
MKENTMKSKVNKKKFRVFINQVNRCWVDVVAKDVIEAADKGYAKWRRYEAHSYVETVQELGGGPCTSLTRTIALGGRQVK